MDETSEPRVARMEPIATLPVFFKLRGRRVVLVGGSDPATWKAELLSAAGARVDVIDPEPCDGLVALARDPPDGPVMLHRRAWVGADLQEAALALGALEEEAEAARFRNAARAAGVPVNVIDKPAFCDFQFGTVVSRSPLVIGISTDGASPVFGQAIRARIEALLPQGLKRWAEAAREWRPAVQDRGLTFRERRRFWEVFAARALRAGDAAPGPDDLAACLDVVDPAADAAEPARLTLVGAGPGDPNGATLEAVGVLQDADRVFYDSRLSPALLGLARREAAKIPLGRGAPHDLAVAVTREDRRGHSVWLDTGNPLACRRWDQRSAALAAVGDRMPRKVAGLGRCEDCDPSCSSWTAAAR